jgi:hypothetical protein
MGQAYNGKWTMSAPGAPINMLNLCNTNRPKLLLIPQGPESVIVSALIYFVHDVAKVKQFCLEKVFETCGNSECVQERRIEGNSEHRSSGEALISQFDESLQITDD